MSTTTTDPEGDLLAAHPQQKCELGNGEILTYRIFPAQKEERHTLVYLPGYSCDADSFGAILSLYPSFEDHRIIAINPRGYNGSTNHTSVFSHEDNAEDVKLLLDKIGVAKTMVLGYSTGGCLAAWLALKYPNMITAAFLQNSIALNGIVFSPNNNEPVLTHEDVQKYMPMIDSFLGYDNKNPDAFYGFWSSMMVPGKAPAKESPKFQRWVNAAFAFESRYENQVANQWFNITPVQTPRSPPSTVLKDLQVPLIIIHGVQDAVVSYKQMRALAELAIACEWAPKGMISYYEHPGGHLAYFECPEEFNALYRKALEEQVLKKGEDNKEE